MSDNPLIKPIEGYQITVVKKGVEFHRHIKTLPLTLSRVGGCHVRNAEDLIMMIEDAVFNNEMKEANERNSD